MDNLTNKIVSEWVVKYDEAVQREDFNGMQEIIEICCSSPNQPFRRELCRQLGL